MLCNCSKYHSQNMTRLRCRSKCYLCARNGDLFSLELITLYYYQIKLLLLIAVDTIMINDQGFHPETGGILCIKGLQLLFGRKINAIVYYGKYILLSCARQCVRDACGRGSQKISPMLSGIGDYVIFAFCGLQQTVLRSKTDALRNQRTVINYS